jgi:hypothetical protein
MRKVMKRLGRGRSKHYRGQRAERVCERSGFLDLRSAAWTCCGIVLPEILASQSPQ